MADMAPVFRANLHTVEIRRLFPASQPFDPQEMRDVQTEGDGHGVAKNFFAACLIAVGAVRRATTNKGFKIARDHDEKYAGRDDRTRASCTIRARVDVAGAGRSPDFPHRGSDFT
jgi:hypothetical protein